MITTREIGGKPYILMSARQVRALISLCDDEEGMHANLQYVRAAPGGLLVTDGHVMGRWLESADASTAVDAITTKVPVWNIRRAVKACGKTEMVGLPVSLDGDVVIVGGTDGIVRATLGGCFPPDGRVDESRIFGFKYSSEESPAVVMPGLMKKLFSAAEDLGVKGMRMRLAGPTEPIRFDTQGGRWSFVAMPMRDWA